MASFGSFETDREVYSGPTYTVYSARRSGDPKTEYAIKLFSIRVAEIDTESAAQLEPLLEDIERSCMDRITVQQKGAAASKFVTPVLETGRDERGVWYATHFYARSINKIISGKVELTPEALQHLIRSVVQGALDLKRTCGRSHGEILPSNVQISKTSLSEADVVISDPLPGDASEAARYEKSDLRAIGELIYQLVHKRIADFQWVMVPLDPTPDWSRMFGKQAPRWLDLCNRLLDKNLSLDRVNLESLEREFRPSAVKAKLPLVAAALVAVFVLGGGGYFGIQAVIKWHQRSSEESFQTAMKEASSFFNDGRLLEASEKIDLALQKKPRDAGAAGLKKNIDDSIAQTFQVAISGARDALGKHNYLETTNQAGIALRMKPGDQEANNLMAQGKQGIEDDLRGKNRERECDDVKNLARKAEANEEWPQALSEWQKARSLCKDDQDVRDGIAFATAMTNVLAKLKEAQAKAGGTITDAQHATNIWGQVLRDLSAQEVTGRTQVRSNAMSKVKQALSTVWAGATSRITVLVQGGRCEEAKGLAQQAEASGLWSEAVSQWQKAESLCNNDQEVRDGIVFTRAMTNALAKLKLAQDKAGGTIANAQEATNLWGQVLRGIPPQQISERTQARSSAMRVLREDLAKVLTVATNQIAALMQGQKCEDVKSLAQKAERNEAWAEALSQWQIAGNLCKNDQDVREGITFVTAMSNAIAKLREAQSKVGGGITDAQQATNLLGQMLRELPAQELAARNPARSNAVSNFKKELASIWTGANDRIAGIMQDQKCKDAKSLALQEEGKGAWPEAVSQWQKAGTLCKDDRETREGVTFATGIRDALAKLKEAQLKISGTMTDVQQATNLWGQMLKEIPAQELLARNPARSNAVNNLKKDLASVRTSATSRMAGMVQEQKCEEAKVLARKADGSGTWFEALGQWQQAATQCKSDPEARDGIAFAAGMLDALEKLKGAQQKAGGNMTDAQQVTNLWPQILRGLPPRELWERNPARSNAVSSLEHELAIVWGHATNRVAALMQAQKCDEAKSLAQKAEANGPWSEALNQWQKAESLCKNDQEISQGIAFARALTTAKADLERVNRIATNSVNEAQQAATLCVSAQANLAAQRSLATGEVRSTALNELVGEISRVKLASDRVIARDSFEHSAYENALQICKNHPDDKDLKDLQERIKTEQRDLRTFEGLFANSDYSFIDQIRGRPYEGKGPFAGLMKDARLEKGTLEELTALKTTNDWSGVLRRTAEFSSAAFLTKPRFIEVVNWATTQQQENKRQLEARLSQLDSKLEVLLVNFGILKPRNAKTGDGKNAGQLGIISDQVRDQYFKAAEDLERQFKQGGWLESEGRKKNLEALKKAINTPD